MAETRWGRASGVGARIGMAPVMALMGAGFAAYVAVKDGEKFSELYPDLLRETLDSIAEEAEDFGDRHADKLTSAAKFVGSTAASAAIGGLTRGAGNGMKAVWQAKPPGA